MAGNSDPIFSRVGVVSGTFGPITTAAADYTGNSPYNYMVFDSDATNGGYIQRLRFKAIGTNVATVARVYINTGFAHTTSLLATPGTPAGTPSTETLLYSNCLGEVEMQLGICLGLFW